jgi:predicted flap endonuclease-1-like 5' DNA nuclease
MRSDYAFYAIAIILFILTGIMLAYPPEPRELWIVTTAVLGLLFIGLGYSQRPKAKTKSTASETPPPTPSPVTEVVEEKIPVETALPKIELTEVKGIGEKRAEQLKTLGISSVEDLAKASVDDLAAKLKISPKITGKWIESAKKLVEK